MTTDLTAMKLGELLASFGETGRDGDRDGCVSYAAEIFRRIDTLTAALEHEKGVRASNEATIHRFSLRIDTLTRESEEAVQHARDVNYNLGREIGKAVAAEAEVERLREELRNRPTACCRSCDGHACDDAPTTGEAVDA